jgi:O-antigen/teichoic acid export membrane protein
VIGLLARRFLQLGGRFDLYNGLDIGRTVLFLLLALVAAALLPRQAVGATSAWLLAELGLALVAGLFVWRTLEQPSAAASGLDRGLAAQLARSGAPIQLGLLAMFVGNEGGAYVLNARLDLAAVGIYSVALAVSRLVLQISIALRTALQPRLVGPEPDAAAVTARVTRHGLLWMLLAAAGLALGSPLVPVVFTREFGPASEILLLLLPGTVAYGVWQLVAGHLLRIGRRGLLAANSWLFAVAAILLQAIGAQTLGLSGAAIGLTLAYLLGGGVASVAFLRLSHTPARELLPAASDLTFYVHLMRGLVASVRADGEPAPSTRSDGEPAPSTRSAAPRL